MAVIESKGNGYSLFNGVKLPSLPEWDRETYPYAFITKRKLAYLNFFIVLSNVPYNHSANSKPISSANATTIMSSNNREGFTVWKDYGSPTDREAMSELAIGEIIWANYEVLNATDNSTYLAASDPISLDGMNVIEWDGDTTGLEGFNGETTFYHVSNATDVDVSHPYHLVRKFESDGHLAMTTANFVTNDGWYGMGAHGRYINTASETYSTVGVYLRKPTQTTILFAYIPIVTATDHTVYRQEGGKWVKKHEKVKEVYQNKGGQWVMVSPVDAQ